MEQVKYDAVVGENSVKRYASPRTTAVFVKAQRVLCQSNGNDSMGEYDFGDGGFNEEKKFTGEKITAI